MRPETLLGFCFQIGCGMSLFGPSWQASVPEQVPAEARAPAIALNGISFNIVSFGPAIGGVIVASAGSVAAFAPNALCYLPLIAVLLWRRSPEPSRLPPERLAGAVVAGVRYIANSRPVRIALGRTPPTIGTAGSGVSALLGLVARRRRKLWHPARLLRRRRGRRDDGGERPAVAARLRTGVAYLFGGDRRCRRRSTAGESGLSTSPLGSKSQGK